MLSSYNSSFNPCGTSQYLEWRLAALFCQWNGYWTFCLQLCLHCAIVRKAVWAFKSYNSITAVSRRIMFSGRPSLLNWLDFGVHGWKVSVAVTSYQSHARISGMFRENCFKVATISIWTQGWTDFGGQRSGSVWPVVCPVLMNMIFPERIEGISSYLAQMCI